MTDYVGRVLREQFIALHQSHILESLSQHFQSKYLGLPPPPLKKGNLTDLVYKKRKAAHDDKYKFEEMKRKILFLNSPEKGSLEINVVKDSIYFFS